MDFTALNQLEGKPYAMSCLFPPSLPAPSLPVTMLPLHWTSIARCQQWTMMSATIQHCQRQSVSVSSCWASAGTDSDGRHLDHGPFAASILPGDVGLRVVVPLQL